MAVDGGRHEAARARARAVADRLTAEPAFRARVEANPVATLIEAGLPEEGIEDVLRELAAGVDVGGYYAAECKMTCGLTCVFTVVV